MATKRKVPVKKPLKKEVAVEKTAKPQFVTEVVEELPVNEGVDVPEEVLETIKEKAEEIEEVVEEIQEKKEEDLQSGHSEEVTVVASDEPGDGETESVEEVAGEVKSPEEKKQEDKDTLAGIFSKESTPEVYPDIAEHKRIGAAPVFLWAVIIISVALLTGGTLLVVASGLPKLPTIFAKPTPTPAPTPTPTPAPAARSDIKVQVQNGGGTPGSAGKAKTFLEKKGYTVADVGNTDEYTFKKTEIHVKAGKDAYLTFLKEDVAEDYTVGTAAADLAADSLYDAQVIVGKK